MKLIHLGALDTTVNESLEMENGVVSQPLGLNFTQNHRLQSIMLQFKEIKATDTTLIVP